MAEAAEWMTNTRVFHPHQPPATVGMGVTMIALGEHSPGTVIEVRHYASGPRKGEQRIVRVQEDRWEKVAGSFQLGTAECIFAPDSQGLVHQFFRRPNGVWVAKGGGRGLIIGRRSAWVEPRSFSYSSDLLTAYQ